MDQIQAPDQFADPEVFSLERARLQRRRKIAEQLLQTPIETIPGTTVGSRYVAPNPGEYFNAAMQKVLAARDDTRLDEEEQALSRRESEMSSKMLSSIPSATKRVLGEDLSQGPSMSVQDNSEARQNAQLQAMRNPSLRDTIKAQMGMDEAQAKRIELGEQKAADRVAREQEREDKQKWQEEQNKLYRRTADQIAAAASNSRRDRYSVQQGADGKMYRVNLDTGEASPIQIAGGEGALTKPLAAAKPLTAKQLETQRGFMDLESSIANYEKLLDAYDPRGGTAISPSTRAALEGAYTDVQMKLKTLYELGAPQAGDLKLLSQSIPNPTDLSGTLRGAAFGSAPFKAKLDETKKLLNTSRTNFETQMGRETPKAAKPAPQAAIDLLKKNPALAPQFKAKYGYLPEGF